MKTYKNINYIHYNLKFFNFFIIFNSIKFNDISYINQIIFEIVFI